MVKLRLIPKLILCGPGTDLIFALWMEGKFYFLLQMSLGGWVVDSGDTNARGALFQNPEALVFYDLSIFVETSAWSILCRIGVWFKRFNWAFSCSCSAWSKSLK